MAVSFLSQCRCLPRSLNVRRKRSLIPGVACCCHSPKERCPAKHGTQARFLCFHSTQLSRCTNTRQDEPHLDTGRLSSALGDRQCLHDQGRLFASRLTKVSAAACTAMPAVREEMSLSVSWPKTSTGTQGLSDAAIGTPALTSRVSTGCVLADGNHRRLGHPPLGTSRRRFL